MINIIIFKSQTSQRCLQIFLRVPLFYTILSFSMWVLLLKWLGGTGLTGTYNQVPYPKKFWNETRTHKDSRMEGWSHFFFFFFWAEVNSFWHSLLMFLAFHLLSPFVVNMVKKLMQVSLNWEMYQIKSL